MAKTLKDLLLALLNATLILLALCLFLGWKLVSTVDGVTSKFAENLQVVDPFKEQAQDLREELAGLRIELADLRTDDGVLDEATALHLNQALGRLEQVEERLQSVQTRFADMADSPELLIDQAITTSADVIADQVIEIRGCVPET